MKRVLLAVGVAGLAACGNVSGHVSATKLGDTTHLAERRSPLDELRAACGDGAVTVYGETALKRQPYLQQVTSVDAKIGWVSPGVGEQVTLTNPTGAMLSVAPGVIDSVALRSAGEKQMWSTLGALQPDNIYCYQIG